MQHTLIAAITQMEATQLTQQRENERARTQLQEQLAAFTAAAPQSPSLSPFIASGTAPPAALTVPPKARRRPHTNTSSSDEGDKAEHGLYGWQKDAKANAHGDGFDAFMAALSAPETFHVEKDYDYLVTQIINHEDPRQLALLHRVNISDAATQRLRGDYKAKYFRDAKGAGLEPAQLKFWELRSRQAADGTLKSVQQAIMGLLQARYRQLYIESRQLSKCENAGEPPARTRDSIVAEHVWLFQLRQLIPARVDKAQSNSLLNAEQLSEQAYMDRMQVREPSKYLVLLEQQKTRIMAQQLQQLTQAVKPKNPNRPAPGDKDKDRRAKDKDKCKTPKDGAPLVKDAGSRAGNKPGSRSS
jgi:hypothetical protein